MKAKAGNSSKKIANYGLPEGFQLIHDSIPFDIDLGKGKELDAPTKFDDYLSEIADNSYSDIDCQVLAKDVLNLPIKPSKYYFSLLLYKIVNDKDVKKLEESYPSKYGWRMYKEDIDKLDYGGLEVMIVDIKWKDEIQKSISKHFKPYNYRGPMPCLIKYSICGCYKGDDIMQDDVGNKNKYFQHSPWIDKDYHKVILNAPLRFRYDFKISDFCEAMVTKVNEYAQRRVFSLKEFSEMWSELLYIKYSLVNNDIDTDELKEIFNAKIDLYKIKPTPQHDFYLQHYLDYLDDFEKGKILKRCRYCDKAFDFKDKKLYCNAKCARAAQNLRGYQRYTPTRKRTSRIRMRKYRQNGDYLDKRRQSSQD